MVDNAIQANEFVGLGQADMAFINNRSLEIAEKIGSISSNIRTVLPLTTRLFFAFSKRTIPDTATARELFSNQRIGIQSFGGESQMNIERFFKIAKITPKALVKRNESPDVVVFWDTFFGIRATEYLEAGWHPFSFKENWITFLTLNEPSVQPYFLPAIPGDVKSKPINTVATQTLLVINQDIGENAVYELAFTFFQNKQELIYKDLMYRTIDETFNQRGLLYPLHEGTSAFLRRDNPTFLERYSDTIAMVLSIAAVMYGIVQAIRSRLTQRKKDRIDNYFLDFLTIRSDKRVPVEEKIKKLDNLFQRAVEQMTDEKLEKSDFHILSRLIQQELTIISFSERQ